MTTTRSAPGSSGSSGASTSRAAVTAAGGPAGSTASGRFPARAARTWSGERSAAGTRVRCRATRGKPTSLPHYAVRVIVRRVARRPHPGDARLPGAAAHPVPRHRRPRRRAGARARRLGRVLPVLGLRRRREPPLVGRRRRGRRATAGPSRCATACRSTSPCRPSTRSARTPSCARPGAARRRSRSPSRGRPRPTTWPGSRPCATRSGRTARSGSTRTRPGTSTPPSPASRALDRGRAGVRGAAVRDARGAGRAAPPDRRPGRRRRGGPAGGRPAAGGSARGVRRRRPQGAAAGRRPGRAAGGRGPRAAVRRVLGAGVLRSASRPGSRSPRRCPSCRSPAGWPRSPCSPTTCPPTPLLPVDGVLPVGPTRSRPRSTPSPPTRRPTARWRRPARRGDAA